MNKLNYILFALLAVALHSCEEPYEPDTIEADQQYVVEGYIEAGAGAFPTYVLLTRSLPFVGEISGNEISDLFVRGAAASVSDGENTITLTEICLDQVPAELQAQVGRVLGFDPSTTEVNFCVYVDLTEDLIREQGRSYELTIDVDGTTITSTTTIPVAVPLYNLKFEDPPGDPNDTMATLKVTIDDPADISNYYRYFTSTMEGPLVPPFASVVDDAFFNGKEFEFPLNRAIPRGEEVDVNTIGLFTRGDSITLKWCTIDEAHFNFWNTFDFNNNSGGPFSSYTRVDSNVDGALGIWGGYAVNTYREKVVVE